MKVVIVIEVIYLAAIVLLGSLFAYIEWKSNRKGEK